MFTEEDVKESLEEVGIKLVPQSEEGKVKITSEGGETACLDEDFPMFDSLYLKRYNGVIDVTTKLFRHPKCLKHKDENATPYYDAHALVIKMNDYEVDVIFEGTDKYYTFIPQTYGGLRKALNEITNNKKERN